MNAMHYTEDELTSFYYGETKRPSAVQAHLDVCAACAESYGEIRTALAQIVPPEMPERGELYGLEVWQRIRPLLPSAPPAHPVWQLPRLGFASVTALSAALIVATAMTFSTFKLARFWPDAASAPAATSTTAPSDRSEPGDRMRRLATADHLEQSERLLLDFVNDTPRIGASAERARIGDLIDANRIYRQAARSAGDAAVADVLDDLERNLLDIAHGPVQSTPSDLDAIRERLDATAVLFKLRVLSSQLEARPQPRPGITT